MKNRGFTLAEVLITLAIIGIVATLTLPAINLNVQKQQVGPSLAKAVNTLSNANKLAFADDDVRHLSSISENYLDIMSKYVVGYSDGSGGYISKDGIVFSSNNFSEYPVNITVDINGAKLPNTIGKDRFIIYIYNDGAVVPYGGYEYKKYSEGSTVLWAAGCSGDSVTNPSSCSGAIADNGWAVKYKYELIPNSTSDDNSNSNSNSNSSVGGGSNNGNSETCHGRVDPITGKKCNIVYPNNGLDY